MIRSNAAKLLLLLFIFAGQIGHARERGAEPAGKIVACKTAFKKILGIKPVNARPATPAPKRDFLTTQPAVLQAAPAPEPGIEGLTVKEWSEVPPSKDIIPVTPAEHLSFYGQPDYSKIKKSPEVPATVGPQPSDKWHRSVIDVGDGNVMTVIYKIIEKKKSGKFVIQFENPLHRGQFETREVTASELRRGYKEVEETTKAPNQRQF